MNVIPKTRPLGFKLAEFVAKRRRPMLSHGPVPAALPPRASSAALLPRPDLRKALVVSSNHCMVRPWNPPVQRQCGKAVLRFSQAEDRRMLYAEGSLRLLGFGAALRDPGRFQGWAGWVPPHLATPKKEVVW